MKLKQKLAIGLCTFYIFSVIGIALSMHFCGGKLAAVSVTNAQAACKYCKAETADKKDDGCCKNTKIEAKIKDTHQVEGAVKLPKLFSLATLLHPKFYDVLSRVLPSYFSNVVNKSPPKTKGVALHIFNCVFRN